MEKDELVDNMSETGADPCVWLWAMMLAFALLGPCETYKPAVLFWGS
jgi:hypothetical protein